MIKKSLILISTVLFSAQVFAYAAEDMHPTYQWIENPVTATGVQTTLGLGILDSNSYLGSGTSMFFDATAGYAVDENLGVSLSIPLAGTISDNNDGFGLGNIGLDARYFFNTENNLVAGIATELGFATTTTDATVGTATRKFYRYTQDQWAVVPTGVIGFEQENLQVLGQVGLPVQIFNNDGKAAFEGDRFETSLSYDVGASIAVNDTREFWVTAEAGGYSTLSLNNNQNEFFGSVGAQYQNDELAFGASVGVPFTSGAQSVHNVLFYGNFSYRFQ